MVLGDSTWTPNGGGGMVGTKRRAGLESGHPGVCHLSLGTQNGKPVVGTKAGPRAAGERTSCALTIASSLPFQLLP